MVLVLGSVIVMMICLLNDGYRTCIDLVIKANRMILSKLID